MQKPDDPREVRGSCAGAELDRVEGGEAAVDDKGVHEQEKDAGHKGQRHDDGEPRQERAQRRDEILLRRSVARPGHVPDNVHEEEGVERYQGDYDRYDLDERRDRARNEEVEPLEEQLEADRRAPHLFEEADIDAAHHRP